MKNSKTIKAIILVLVPYLAGAVISMLLNYGLTIESPTFWSLINLLIYAWQIGSAIYWFLVGKYFGGLKLGKLKGIIYGNIAWGISLILFVWQFMMVQENRNIILSSIPQHYILGFSGWSSMLLSFFTQTIDGINVMLVAHLMMLALFLIGYKYAEK